MPNTPPCPYWIERFAIRNVLTLHPECWIKCARDLATRHGLGAIVVHSFCGDYRRQKVGFLAVAANPWLPECFSDYDADVELVIGTPSRTEEGCFEFYHFEFSELRQAARANSN